MSSRYITAIDIGTSKVAAIVGEKTSAGIRIVGYSEVPSDGVVRGEILKSQKTANAVSAALHNVREQIQSIPEAENYRIRKVYTNISGQNIRCVSGTVHRERQNPESSISRDEIDSMLNEMYLMRVEPSEQVLYVAPQCYNVDEHMGETDPEDMDGREIDGEYKVFIGRAAAVNHSKSAFDRLNLEVREQILTPMASGAALLTEDEKELGTVLVDIGAGTTGVLVYQADILRYAAVIPFGGDSVTEDISQTCSISRKNAEQLKIQKGTCISEFAKDTVLTIKESGVTVKGIPCHRGARLRDSGHGKAHHRDIRIQEQAAQQGCNHRRFHQPPADPAPGEKYPGNGCPHRIPRQQCNYRQFRRTGVPASGIHRRRPDNRGIPAGGAIRRRRHLR